ncbi:hypothetical protein ALT1000_10146 [Alteromonas macleodii]
MQRVLRAHRKSPKIEQQSAVLRKGKQALPFFIYNLSIHSFSLTNIKMLCCTTPVANSNL